MPSARGAAGRGDRARPAARRLGRDARAAPRGRRQDRAAARRLPRPAHAADRDRGGRRGARLADAHRRGARASSRSVITAESTRLSRLIDNLLDLSRLEAGAASRARLVLDRGGDPRRGRGPPTAAAELSLAARPRPAARARRRGAARARVRQPARERGPPLGRPSGLRAGAGRPAAACSCASSTAAPASRPPARARVRAVLPRGHASAGHRGSGLGLAIVRGFVEANGGRISVESLPGQGTTLRRRAARRAPRYDEPVPDAPPRAT